MADPVTLGTIGIGSSIAGSGISAFGALSGGASKGAMFDYQSGVALANAKIARQNEDFSLSVGERQAAKYGLKARYQAGEIKTAQGSSGINVNEGSAKEVQDSQHLVAGMDMATIRDNAARRAYGYYVEGEQDKAQARLYSDAARDSRRAGSIGALTSLLSGVTSVSSKWLQGTTAGMFGPGVAIDEQGA